MSEDSIIPQQHTGAVSNTEHNVDCNDVQEAKELYQTARNRLLDISSWEHLTGLIGADFQIVDAQGKTLARNAEVGDYVRIDIPGPGPATGDGYDWVVVEAVDEQKNEEEDVERIAIRVKPTSNPTNADPTTAHFFTSDATSNFIVRREHKTVFSAVLGRNESPNLQEAEGKDKVRNAVVGTGAIAGASKLQWGQLVKGLLS